MTAKAKLYDGPVCYVDGWHHTVVKDQDGNDAPGDRLVLEDNGYRLATDADTESWHDRTHGQFVTVQMEDGTPGITVTADEAEAIKALLAERRGDQ